MCFLLELEDGGGPLYDSVHAEMSPRLRQGLADCGYENYTIFRSGTTVVGYAECHPDVESVLRRQAELSTDELSPLASVVARPLRLADQVWRLQDDAGQEKATARRPAK